MPYLSGDHLMVSLLGPPQVEWLGSPLLIHRRYTRALLYRLACNPQPVTRQHLHFLLWPDEPEEIARRNLSHQLTHLRRALPAPGLILASGDLVSINSQLVWTDVIQLESSLQANRPEDDHLIQAVSLYRGPFLDGFGLPNSPEFEHWCLLERNSLERLYLEALAILVERCSSRGEINGAIKYARCYLETDELSETMHQHLIRLFTATGNRCKALRQFERCSTVLQRELGVSPLPETRAIYQAILDGELRHPDRTANLHTIGLSAADVRLVGREEELDRLETAFTRAEAYCSQVVLISGEAGIGKSRLMHDFATRHQGEATLLYGYARSGGQAIPYQPIIGALRIITGVGEARLRQRQAHPPARLSPPDYFQPLWLAETSRLLPEILLFYPALPAPSPVEPECTRARLFDALSNLTLSYCAAHGATILCLDDLHWMDRTTGAWLAHLGSLLAGNDQCILVVGTYRTDEAESVAHLRDSLARSGVLVEIELSGLKKSAVLQVLRSLVGQRSGDELLAGKLHEATGGNPFFLIEMLREKIEQGKLEEYVDRPEQLPLPGSVRDAIRTRLKILSPIARQVLEAGAILGQSFGSDLLRLTAGRGQVEMADALDELAARQLLVAERGKYRFVHELIRRAVEEGLNHLRAQLLHRRAGRAYQHIKPDTASSLAYHFEMGGDLPKALHYHQRAARRAQELFAWNATQFHLDRMLALFDQLQPNSTQQDLIRQRCSILSERAQFHYLQARLADRDADLMAINDLGEASGDDEVRLQAIVQRVRYLNLDGEYIQSVATAREGLALMKSSSAFIGSGETARTVRSRLLAQVGLAYYFLGRPQEALGVLQDAIELCGESAGPEARGRILHILGYVYFHLGNYARALQCQQQACACHQETGDSNRLAWDLIDIGALHKNLGNLSEARRFMQEGLQLSRRAGAHPAEAYGLAHIGSYHLHMGEYSTAVDHFQRALEMQHDLGSEQIITAARTGAGLAFYHLGDYVQSRSWLERALQRARLTGHRRRMAQALIQLGLLDIAEGCLPFARQHLEEGLALARDCQSVDCLAAGLAASARLERLSGDPAGGLDRAGQAVRAAQQIGLTGCEMWAEIEAGLAHLALGDLSSALEHTQRATALAPQASQDWMGREEAHRAHALVLRALGQTDEAQEEENLAQSILQAKIAPGAAIGV